MKVPKKVQFFVRKVIHGRVNTAFEKDASVDWAVLVYLLLKDGGAILLGLFGVPFLTCLIFNLMGTEVPRSHLMGSDGLILLHLKFFL